MESGAIPRHVGERCVQIHTFCIYLQARVKGHAFDTNDSVYGAGIIKKNGEVCVLGLGIIRKRWRVRVWGGHYQENMKGRHW